MRYQEATRLLDQAETDFRMEAAEIERMASPSLRQSDDVGEMNSSGQHPADTASETVEREIALGLLADVKEVLVEIGAARRRLAAGVFGRCQSCGHDIDPERLAAVPWARRCATDENHRESSWPVPTAAVPPNWQASDTEAEPASEDSTWDPEDDHPVESTEESMMHEFTARSD